jgi:hypothetical protein
MSREAQERAEALRLVLSRRQMFPPSSDELYPAIEETLRCIRAKRRGIEPREDQIAMV